MTASNVTELLFQRLTYSGDKQKIISSNIANINTPNYKTKGISFDNHLINAKNKHNLALNTTHNNHIAFDTISNNNSLKDNIFNVKGLEEQNDGNNVNLDKQISEMAKNSVMYDAITSSIKKDAQWFKFVLDASSKN